MKISLTGGRLLFRRRPPGRNSEEKTMEIPLLYSLNTEARTPT